MSDNDMFLPSPVAKAGRTGQATEVAKAKAITEAQGAIYMARQFPRDIEAARQRMLIACAQPELADKAFFSYQRGDDEVRGLTIHAACELAVSWGNIKYGLNEMRRDDEYGQSETLAWAWDLETNVQVESTFIALHVRELKGGRTRRVTSPRDIYEVVTNQGNRRMRAAILKVLPRWYKLQAEEALQNTMRRMVEANNKSPEQRATESLNGFSKRFGVTRSQLEHHVGKPVEQWNTDVFVKLKILWGSLSRGDVSVEEAFPDAKVTADEILATGAAAPTDQPVPAADEELSADVDEYDGHDEDTAPPQHNGHPDGEYDAWCEGCTYSREMDRKAAEE